MRQIYFLMIPVFAGIITGLFLAFNQEHEDISIQLTKSKLVEGGSPILGSPSAPITIVEWGDYQCTYCYKFHETSLNDIKEKFVDTGKVKMIFRDFPLNGADSILASQAAFCAEEQNKYWQFHNIVYQNWAGERTGWITSNSLRVFAEFAELDLSMFDKCMELNSYQDKINQSYEFGKEIGIDATPSFLVFNDEKVIKIRGNQPLEVFLKAFDEL